MSDLLNIGASGVRAYRNALSAVGDNIVNAETPGYARRTVVLKESALTGGANPIYRDRVQFGGVDAASVRRAWDEFKAADSRLSAGIAGRADARLRWLETGEAALDDGASGVGQRITAFFNAADALAGDPGSDLGRRAMLLALDEAAGAVRTTSEQLTRVRNGITGEARATVDAVNAGMDNIARVNLGLRRVLPGSAAHAQLQDERDRLIDELSKHIDVEAQIAPDGVATLTIARVAGITLFGDRGGGALLGLDESADGRLSILLSANGATAPITPTGGTLAGLVETAAGNAEERAALDALAADFAQKLNDWNAAGLTPGGVAGPPLLTIGLAGAETLKLATTNPADIAAASTGGIVNGNLLDLSALRGAGGVEARWALIVTGHAQATSAARSEETAATARRDGAFAARDEVSGIDLDHEAAELIRFQQAYDGSARVIQVARETLNTLLDLL